ncbi:hypothetical protein AB0B31_17310 [Catellatospora citrea]|uniref:hypothetical protein n=1 Tax=Catellatospora citrea TaxID=53366 RepID=UPI0033FE3803
MGMDLEWAILPEAVEDARRQAVGCGSSGVPCGHDPDCRRNLARLLAPCEFGYRQFHSVTETMLLLGMGYEAEPMKPALPSGLNSQNKDADPEHQRLWDEAWHAWEAQRIPGRTGIALFKLRSNDGWLVTVDEIEEALTAYEAVPAADRVLMEATEKWAAWVEWLRVTRHHGGFTTE